MTRPAARPGSAWYQQPVLWLGAVVFAASLAGCVWMIMLGMQHDDSAVEAPRPVFGVPARSHAAPAPAGSAAADRAAAPTPGSPARP
ncbi:hypothetical protein [Dyella sp.]|jgi:hypothetical protein|uniref:hypothetical protein n=1 Tax=Dyella sp. TaxID=1869338 RepID=UPI002D76B93A|nr:hypothetical protein [Dyella sp.]HET6433866.1 hypothetical protein [Dyella sp.]